MVAKFVNLSAGLFLLLSTALSFPQVVKDKQQEFREHILKAQGYLSEKRPDLAIPELQAAAAIDPEDVDTQGNLGVLLYFQGKASEAIPHLRIAVEKQPSLVKIQGILGIAELRTSDFTQSRKDLEASFPLIQDQRFRVEVGLDLVTLYAQGDDLDLAAGVLAQLRKLAPNNPEVLYAAYRTYSDLSFESMLALSLAAPDSAQMHQLLANEETKEGNTNGAITQYRKAITIDPHLPGVHFELAELLETARDPAAKAEAMQEYRAALADNPQDEKTICKLADMAAENGNIRLAYEDYSKAVQLQPGDANATLGLAKSLIDMNEKDKALPLLERTVQLEPTNAIAHYRLATLYREKGRIDDARREVELYKKYKDLKDKLRALYKNLLIQPQEIRDEGQDEK
jgi:tetratricopeptide (TPR) repeat protein